MDKKKLGTRITAMFLTVLMIFTIVPFSAFAANIIDSGKCGDNVYWTLYDDGELVINGTGETYDYSDYKYAHSPWCTCEFEYHANRPKIKTVIIKDGVTSIGDCLFQWCDDLKNVTLPNGITEIGWNAFFGTELKTITIPDSVIFIGPSAFSSFMTTIYYTGTQEQWKQISIDEYNDEIQNATIIFNSPKEELSIVDAYKRVLQTYQTPYTRAYTVYDIDKDNIPELIIGEGLYDVSYRYEFYTFSNGQEKYIGEAGGGYSSLYGIDGQNGLYIKRVQMGNEDINMISIENNQLCDTFISSKWISPPIDYEGIPDEPTELDNYLEMISTDDYSLLEELTNDPITCNHKWGSWITTRAATCTASGAQIRYCSVCAGLETREIAALGHSYSSEWTIDVAATSTTEGSKSHHCIRCDAKTDVTPIEKQTKTTPDGYNFETDRWKFKNIDETIDRRYFYDMFGSGEKGDEVYDWMENGETHGHCFGMAVSTTSTLMNCPDVEDYSHQQLVDVSKGSINLDLGIAADTYIKYCHVYQGSSAISAQRNSSSYQGIRNVYNAVAKSANNKMNTTGIVIDLWGGPGGHTVYAIGVDGNDILVNDSNEPGSIKRIHTNGDSWNYSGGGWTWDSTIDATINYVDDVITPYLNLRNKAYANTKENNGEQAVENASYTEDEELNGTTDHFSTTIKPVDTDKLLVVAETDSFDFTQSEDMYAVTLTEGNSTSRETKLYWLNSGNKINAVNISDDESTLKLVGNDLKITADLPTEAAATMTISDETLGNAEFSVNTGDELSVSFLTHDEDNNAVETTISGTASGDTVTAYAVEDGIDIGGLNDITVTLETADGTDETTAKVADGEKVSIDIDKENSEISISVPDLCEHDYYVSDFDDPLCDVDGYTEYTCSICGDTYTEIIPATGHDGVETVIDGEVCIVCSVCGEILSYDDNMSTFLDIFYPEDFVIGDECILYIGLPSEGVESGVITIYYPSDIVSPTTFSCYADYAESYVLEDGVMQIEFSFDSEAPCDYDDFIDLNFELLNYGSVEFSVETDWIGKENPECAFLYADFAPPSDYTLGDVNNDGQVTAADARLALRISAQLETSDDYMMRAADADKNGRITAADARKILRVSARLESF